MPTDPVRAGFGSPPRAAVSDLAVAVAGRDRRDRRGRGRHLVGVLIATAVWSRPDIALGASPARSGSGRDGDISVRLGEEAQTQLILTNLGRRDLAATVRNAWTPSAGARDGVQRVSDPGPAAAAVGTDPAPDPAG